MWMTSSMLSWAISRPSSRWARSWAFFRSYLVRRTMISSWKARYSSMMCRRERILGWDWFVHQGQHIDGKGGLQLGLGKQAVEHHLGVGVPLQLDDDAHTVAVGLVPDVGDALQTLVLHLVGHVLDEHRAC